ncbi:glycosyltransferase [Methanolobus tindarius DSM 2278]|uniref:Glycosyltransferase n=1 Tax=Methanolobus tindarius DSM 2278 TaxID=1090322 RepID=W9DNZ6_METTI|nr:glycosyltransferase family 4 protein [Methanolobus tindarius]ETA66808.1 glycosyltransferase [Methanolobus tindarius DSM 2278]
MRLLILSSSFPRNTNILSSSFSYEFCKNLLQKGSEVIVLAPHHSTSKFIEEIDGIKVYRFPYFVPFSAQKLAYNAGIAYNFKNSLFAKLQLPFFLLSELIYSLKIIKQEKIDVVISFWLIPQGLIAAICNKILKIKHIAVIHSSEVTILKKLNFGTKITQLIFNHSERIVSVSSHRAHELLSILPPNVSESASRKLHIIPMGIDPSKLISNETTNDLKLKYELNDSFVVLFVGRLVEVKGCKYLINAFKDVVEEYSKAKLIVVGSGYMEEELKELVAFHSLNEKVLFSGFVSSDLISDYYNLADIVVVPSIVDSSGFQEGFPVVVMESLVTGKPIIATKTNGIMEIIHDEYNGILVEQKNENQISDKILKLIQNPDLRKKLSANALQDAKKYEWGVVASNYYKLLNEVYSYD